MSWIKTELDTNKTLPFEHQNVQRMGMGFVFNVGRVLVEAREDDTLLFKDEILGNSGVIRPDQYAVSYLLAHAASPQQARYPSWTTPVDGPEHGRLKLAMVAVLEGFSKLGHLTKEQTAQAMRIKAYQRDKEHALKGVNWADTHARVTVNTQLACRKMTHDSMPLRAENIYEMVSARLSMQLLLGIPPGGYDYKDEKLVLGGGVLAYIDLRDSVRDAKWSDPKCVIKDTCAGKTFAMKAGGSNFQVIEARQGHVLQGNVYSTLLNQTRYQDEITAHKEWVLRAKAVSRISKDVKVERREQHVVDLPLF